MKSKFYLFAGLGLIAVTANGQRLQEDYIQWPNSSSLHDYVSQWKPGQALFEDENFFISRVKPHTLLSRNTAIQIYSNINDENDKRLLMWVPVGNSKVEGVHTDALPNGVFDSEVFSTWSYVTHFGDWISPHGWVPGGFADAAHRHGVAVTGVASVPNASLGSGDAWYKCLDGTGKLSAQAIGDFLLYHGVNGLGYNSEWGVSSSVQTGLQKMHEALNKYMADKDPLFENILYDGVSNSGSIMFSERLHSGNKENFGGADSKRANFFLNYNWNNSSYIATSQQTAEELGRPMTDLYAGMNMQGGCKSATEWQRHLTTNYSIGLWGAHDFNYLWAGRSKNGSSADVKQATYQKQLEQWFTNGVRNPIAKVDVYQTRSLSPSDEFFGMSRFMSARSPYGWSLDDEPFVTYFNLGNGKFFNFEGQLQKAGEWYNIGIQDYMPTWRFWFADKFLGKEPENIPAKGLDAEFTWDDAYFGGSSLKIKGDATDEYLHLFRTCFEMKTNDVITVRYKLVSGSVDMSLALSVEGEENVTIRENETFKVCTSDVEPDDNVWVEKKFTISGPANRPFNGKNLAMIALHFTNASNLEMLLGEISIKRGTTTTPAAPKITLNRVLAYNASGVDAKVIFEMANNKAPEVCYNSDVNTSLFKLWAQQEGEEPILVNATSSWAAILFRIPVNPASPKNMRFGVQALSLDRESASEITWGEYLSLGEYQMSSDIQINKSTIKPGESFEISFIDPEHPAAAWTLEKEDGTVVATGNGTSFVSEGLADTGSYHLVVDGTRYNYYLMVTEWKRGALPEINKLMVNGEEAGEVVTITPNSDIELAYEGRGADGESSRGIEIEERFVGVGVKALNSNKENIVPKQSFGVSAWVKMNYPKASSSLFQIENRAGAWPANNWGYCWFDVDQNGKLTQARFRGQSLEMGFYYDNAVIPNNAWTHLAFSFDYKDGNKFRFRLFINGVEQIPTLAGSAAGGGGVPSGSNVSTDPEGWVSNWYGISTSDFIAFGGGRGSEPNYNNGVVDDFTIWSTSITEKEAKMAMEGLAGKEMPENVLAFYSFENDAVDYKFAPEGQLAGTPEASAFNFALEATGEEGQGIQTPASPTYAAGSPTLENSAFKVVTTPQWTAKRGVLTEAKGSDKEGSVKVNYNKAGDYTATLKLTNALGEDQATYPVLSAAVNVAEIGEEGELSVYTIDNAIVVEMPEAGNYTVAVYDAEGRLVAQRTQNMEAGASMTVGVHAQGVYVLNVVKDGQVLRNVKLLKK